MLLTKRKKLREWEQMSIQSYKSIFSLLNVMGSDALKGLLKEQKQFKDLQITTLYQESQNSPTN